MHMHNNILLLITLITIRLSVRCAGIYMCKGVEAIYVCDYMSVLKMYN
jgi:hypothetical protein